MMLFLGVILLLPLPLHAHGVMGTVGSGGVVVTAQYDTGEAMSYARVKISAPGAGLTFQSGRTDRNGRFCFYPDGPGDWKVIVDDEMGHRLEVMVPVDETLTLQANQHRGVADESSLSRYERALMGISIIFGIFGTILGWRGYNRRNFLFFLVLSGIFFLSLPGTALAKENIVKQDLDFDGKPDIEDMASGKVKK